MIIVPAARTSPQLTFCLDSQPSKFQAVLQPSPLSGRSARPSASSSPQLRLSDREHPAAGKLHTHKHSLSTQPHIHFTPRTTSNRQWTRLGTFTDLKFLLLISGVEINPGPPQTNASQTLTISHININSITSANRLDELQQYVDINNIHILALTETKLGKETATSQYKLHGFHSPLTRHRNRHGGGVAIYIRNTLPFQRLTFLEINDEEWVWAKVKLKDISLIICCIYLPPHLTINRLQQFISNLTESSCQAITQSNTETFIMGDLNAGNIYLDAQFNRHSSVSTFDHMLKDATDSLNLHQIINQPTRITSNCENLLDLIFTTNNQKVIDSGTFSSFSNLDHFPVFAKINVAPIIQKVEPTYTTIWDYSKLNSSLLTSLLINTNWTDILNNDIDTATDLFTSAILESASASIPIKRIKHHPQQKPWVTSELKRNIRKRDRLFKIAKRTQTSFNWDRWRHQRNQVTTLNRKLKEEHLHNQVQKLLTQKLNPHKYHQTLKTITGRTRDDDIPPLETNGIIINDDLEKATLLNDHFATQSTLNIPDTKEPPPHDALDIPPLENITTSAQEVLRIINSLDANKSTGPDGIPVRLIKLIAILIAEPLAALFNKSLAEGRYPSKFKEAHIKPIFKNKGTPSDPTSYRPISILSALSKIFEKIVHKNIYNHITENALLSRETKRLQTTSQHSATTSLLDRQPLQIIRHGTRIYCSLLRHIKIL